MQHLGALLFRTIFTALAAHPGRPEATVRGLAAHCVSVSRVEVLAEDAWTDEYRQAVGELIVSCGSRGLADLSLDFGSRPPAFNLPFPATAPGLHTRPLFSRTHTLSVDVGTLDSLRAAGAVFGVAQDVRLTGPLSEGWGGVGSTRAVGVRAALADMFPRVRRLIADHIAVRPDFATPATGAAAAGKTAESRQQGVSASVHAWSELTHLAVKVNGQDAAQLLNSPLPPRLEVLALGLDLEVTSLQPMPNGAPVATALETALRVHEALAINVWCVNGESGVQDYFPIGLGDPLVSLALDPDFAGRFRLSVCGAMVAQRADWTAERLLLLFGPAALPGLPWPPADESWRHTGSHSNMWLYIPRLDPLPTLAADGSSLTLPCVSSISIRCHPAMPLSPNCLELPGISFAEFRLVEQDHLPEFSMRVEYATQGELPVGSPARDAVVAAALQRAASECPLLRTLAFSGGRVFSSVRLRIDDSLARLPELKQEFPALFDAITCLTFVPWISYQRLDLLMQQLPLLHGFKQLYVTGIVSIWPKLVANMVGLLQALPGLTSLKVDGCGKQFGQSVVDALGGRVELVIAAGRGE